MAGVAIGALVYVHPIAPLYCALAAATGLIVADRRPRALFDEAWPGAAWRSLSPRRTRTRSQRSGRATT